MMAVLIILSLSFSASVPLVNSMSPGLVTTVGIKCVMQSLLNWLGLAGSVPRLSPRVSSSAGKIGLRMRYSLPAGCRGNVPYVLAALLLLSGERLASAQSQAISAGQVEFFEKRVRPVLVESCCKCHGIQKQASGLRLDSRSALLEGGVNGPAVVPGQPDQSLLIQVIRQTHPDIQMPPDGKLGDSQIEAIEAWVKLDLPWSDSAPMPPVSPGSADPTSTHWAFQPIKAPQPPGVRDTDWVRTQVDSFILARLEREGLSPSPPVDRASLIRRLSFDLIGLPPTFEEVDAFQQDPRPDAYERLVERLLASPRYGERWGRYWLDVARYADTKGYVFTEDRNFPYSYTYRDYVIRSFNEDKPYDQFVVEQLAADKLGPGSNPQALTAMGFLTLGRRFLNVQEDIIDDRIDVVCRGLLGLTVSCARCHDHKYDPIPTEDYYSLYGVFASSVEPATPPEIPAEVSEHLARDFQIRLAEKQQAIDGFLTTKQTEVGADLRTRLGAYLEAAYEIGFDGKSPKLDEQATSEKLPRNRLRSVTVRFKERLDASRNTPDPILTPWNAFSALPADQFAMRASEIARGLLTEGAGPVNPILAQSFANTPPASMAEVVTRYGELFAETLGRWTEAEKSALNALPEPDWEQLRQALLGDKGLITVNAENISRLLDRGERDALGVHKNALANLKVTHPGAPAGAMVLNDAQTMVEPRVFLRGNIGRQGKQVPRQFLALLSGPERKPFQNGSGRLELAHAIASSANPLTARVLVNRVWLNHFGTGLVGTPSDFGTRSEPPDHPELLDWLATDLMRGGWSIKNLHRRIVLSSTYEQQSQARPDLAQRDPQNRLFARANRRRLDFESLRDSLLSVTSELDSRMGGRSAPIAGQKFPARRTIYGFIDRQNLDPVYRTFDFASPDSSSPRRILTTVPQQALFLMNSPFVLDLSKRLVAATGTVDETPEVQVTKIYHQILGRSPNTSELATGVMFVETQKQAGPSLPAPVWTYGSGNVDETLGRVLDFQEFTHWTGQAWQPGTSLPDPDFSYLHWRAGGGHVGADQAHAAVLRWTAPEALTVRVEGLLVHEGDQGDGVRGRVVTSRQGVAGEWIAQNSKLETRVDGLVLQAGETVDFVVDCRADHGFDTFQWTPRITAIGGTQTWDAKSEFHGPASVGLSPWEEYVQVLLLTNEFLFVD